MDFLTSGLPQLGGLTVEYAILLGLSSIRILAVMAVFPPAADSVIQGTVRNGLALLWGSFVAYGQHIDPAMHGALLVWVSLKEALIGLVIAYAASTLFWSVETVGAYIDDLTGYNNVQLTNPSHAQQTSLTSTLLSQFAIVMFWQLGGMTFLLGAIYESYRWWPLTSFSLVPTHMLESFVLHQTDSLMQIVAKLSAPMLLVLVLIDMGFALVGKAAHKIDISSLSQPVKGAITVLMLALLASVFIDQVRSQIALVDFGVQIRALAHVAR